MTTIEMKFVILRGRLQFSDIVKMYVNFRHKLCKCTLCQNELLEWDGLDHLCRGQLSFLETAFGLQCPALHIRDHVHLKMQSSS